MDREVRFALGGQAEQVMRLGQLLRMLGHAPGNIDVLMYPGERR